MWARTEMIKILLAEDDEIMRITVRDRLQRNHWQVDAVSNGKDAVKRLEKECYQVVVSDLRMPELDGWGILGFMQRFCPDTGMVLMTSGDGSPSDAASALQRGAAGFILKPFDLDELVVKIQCILDEQGST